MNTPVSSERERRLKFETIADEVFEPLQRFLRRRARPGEAEDALADVMLIVWRRLDDVPSEGVLPWSYGIARRVLANQRRSQERHLRLVERIGSQPDQSPNGDPADLGLDPELATALSSLSEEDRDVLRLWAWEQLEPREVATVLDITVNAATLRLSRARKRLARALSRQNPSPAGHTSVEGT